MSDVTSREWTLLRGFLAVAESRSFSRAAGALGVSPSALSQTVRELEKQVGLRLLNRTTRSVSLTDAGEVLVRRARPAASEIASAMSDARKHGGRIAGTLRVHAFRSAARLYLDPVLPRFCEKHPDVVLDITLDDAVVDLTAGGYDASLRLGEVIDETLVARRLGPDLRQLAVATPDYLERRGRPKHPRDLASHTCIRWRWPGNHAPYAWEFYDGKSWFEVPVNGPVILNDKEMCLRSTLAGVGIGFLVDNTVHEHIEAGRLVPVLERWSAPFPGMFLCYAQQRQMNPALRAFVDAVCKRGARR